VSDLESSDGGSGFGERLSAALGDTPQAVVAKRAQISTSVLNKYMQGSEPGLTKASRLARALGVSLQWLATGEGDANAEVSGFVGIPIYDIRLAAGTASFSQSARILGKMPFDLDLLQAIGRRSGADLGVFQADGDSMEPTIADGARVLIDLADVRLRENIFAFRLGDELRIKRLRRLVEGVEVLSDNPRYPPEVLTGSDLEGFAVIGRALWAGSTL
jgi:phage repressor protein C with HTH and peptisase S24 domain